MPRISALPTTMFPSLLHELAVELAGESHKLTMQQVRTLFAYLASEIGYGDDTVADALDALSNLKADEADLLALAVGVQTLTDSLAAKANTDGSNLAAGFLTRLKWISKAIGEFYIADDNVIGVDIPPSGGSDGVWIELTAGLTGVGQFNNGKLTSESVSGSAPLVQATAVVSAAGPMNGRTIRLLNTERRMLRSGSAGTIENDQMQQITGSFGTAPVYTNLDALTSGAFNRDGSNSSNGSAVGSNAIARMLFDSANSSNARAGNETRPKNIGVRIFRRVG